MNTGIHDVIHVPVAEQLTQKRKRGKEVHPVHRYTSSCPAALYPITYGKYFMPALPFSF